jgi:hypothetical protein
MLLFNKIIKRIFTKIFYSKKIYKNNSSSIKNKPIIN